MGFTLVALIEAGVLATNAMAIINEDWFLRPRGWTVEQMQASSFGADPIGLRLIKFLASIRMIARGMFLFPVNFKSSSSHL
ncbi:MAG: hypothetical protein Q8P67_04715 [archaeon]|nr:hypothetical protein [archaeon]